MGRRVSFLISLVAVCGIQGTAGYSTAYGARFFGAGQKATLADHFHAADVALVVKQVFVEPPPGGDVGTQFTIVRVLRDQTRSYEPGLRIELRDMHPPTAVEFVLLFGSKADNSVYESLRWRGASWCANTAETPKPAYDGIRWDEPGTSISESAARYVAESPSRTVPDAKRLEYFAKFVGDSDPVVAVDACLEFVNADEAGIPWPVKDLPRDLLRRRFHDPKTPLACQATHGLMLGLSGDRGDAVILKRKIIDVQDERRSGIEGVMVGYLLLTGEPGLRFLESAKLDIRHSSDEDAYAAVLAIRYLQSHRNGKFTSERLSKALHLAIDRPGFACTIIADLARYKDWSLQKGLMERYGTADFSDDSTKRAIIRYMIHSTNDLPAIVQENLPRHAVDGATFLRQLRASDPQLAGDEEMLYRDIHQQRSNCRSQTLK